MTEQEDIILIQNILNGNQIAEKTLYDKYKKRITNFIKTKYSNCCDVEDDVSEIMIRVFINLKSFDCSKSKFSSWVFSIAKNYMIDKWRCNANTLYLENVLSYVTSINYSHTGALEPSGNSIISDSNNLENLSSISYISTQLSPQDFTLLDMKYVQGYDYNEIAKEFNLTSTTISNRVNYVKSKLKKNNVDLIN
jgi:RNA polymerase sigma-70 factor (ECF subfamily)